MTPAEVDRLTVSEFWMFIDAMERHVKAMEQT